MISICPEESVRSSIVEDFNLQFSKKIQIVDVIFKDNLSRDGLINLIGEVNKPSVFFWFFGERGLTENCLNYYRKDLSKIHKLKNKTECRLYDLTAWAAGRNNKTNINAFNINVNAINTLGIDRLICDKSSDFFEWLVKEDNIELISFLKKRVLQHSFIYKLSKDFPDTNITIGEIFNNNCPILENLYKMDFGKGYSGLQYIEALYLSGKAVEEKLLIGDKKINIIFALPNNEASYYQDVNKCFDEDIEYYIHHKIAKLYKEKLKENNSILLDLKINIMFYSFAYGKDKWARPYTTGGKQISITDKSQLI